MHDGTIRFIGIEIYLLRCVSMAGIGIYLGLCSLTYLSMIVKVQNWLVFDTNFDYCFFQVSYHLEELTQWLLRWMSMLRYISASYSCPRISNGHLATCRFVSTVQLVSSIGYFGGSQVNCSSIFGGVQEYWTKQSVLWSIHAGSVKASVRQQH